MLESILQFIEQLSDHVSVEVFAFVASFLEELIAPIPSPFVMTIAGSMAAAQGAPIWYLIIIAMIAALGKTIAAVIWYVIADKAEDVVLSKVGRYVGLTHKQVEHFGARFSGRKRDYITLFIIRATPIIPSAPISILAGFLALPKKMFIITTYFGTIVRDFVYLYIGFSGIEAANTFVEGVEGISSIVTIAMAAVGLGVGIWIIAKKYTVHKRSKNSKD
jgi:membrane protein DedA with SNARE-associated domain